MSRLSLLVVPALRRWRCAGGVCRRPVSGYHGQRGGAVRHPTDRAGVEREHPASHACRTAAAPVDRETLINSALMVSLTTFYRTSSGPALHRPGQW